jgi:hypothetical protein
MSLKDFQIVCKLGTWVDIRIGEGAYSVVYKVIR